MTVITCPDNSFAVAVSVGLFAAGFIQTALSQTSTGIISGTVTDPHGAIVAGVSLAATETATGRSYQTETTEAGIYVFPSLPVGIYTITALRPGFKKGVQTDIELRVSLRETVDLRLEVGD